MRSYPPSTSLGILVFRGSGFSPTLCILSLSFLLWTDTSFLWRHLVSPSEIRTLHSRICDDFKSGEGVLITSRWISSIQASNGESRSMSSEVAGKPIVMEDDIRIRNESLVASEMSDIQVFWSLLEHVRVVFPSAVSYVTGEARSNSTLLTFSPTILRKHGAQKIHSALNAGLQLFLPDMEFLGSSSWIETTPGWTIQSRQLSSRTAVLGTDTNCFW